MANVTSSLRPSSHRRQTARDIPGQPDLSRIGDEMPVSSINRRVWALAGNHLRPPLPTIPGCLLFGGTSSYKKVTEKSVADELVTYGDCDRRQKAIVGVSQRQTVILIGVHSRQQPIRSFESKFKPVPGCRQVSPACCRLSAVCRRLVATQFS